MKEPTFEEMLVRFKRAVADEERAAQENDDDFTYWGEKADKLQAALVEHEAALLRRIESLCAALKVPLDEKESQ